MIESISDLQKAFLNGTINLLNTKMHKVIQNYLFFYITDEFMFDENHEIYRNLNKSKILIIDQSKEFNQKTNDQYFIIGFHQSIIIIKQSNINILEQFILANSIIKICFLSDTKNIFDSTFKKNYNECIIHSSFASEISSFILQLRIKNSKNRILKELWNSIQHCIAGFMIKQSYEKLTKDRINDFYFKNDIFMFSNETEEGKDYINLRTIGIGSLFRVDLIYHIEKEKLFAIKTQNSFDAETKKLYERELNNYIKISHPFLPKFYGTIHNKKTIVIEFINGAILKNVHLNDNEKITIIFDLMVVLYYLHQNKLIYRDLKPNNIMIDEQKTLVLIDFDRLILENNKENTKIFSFNYSAPETQTGHFSFESDIYSLGKIIYFIMNEKDPINELSPNDFGAYNDIKNMYLKCTNKKPELRPKFPELILEFFINHHSQIQHDNFVELNEDYFKKIYDKNTIQTMKTIESDPNDSLALFNIGVFYYKGKYVQKNVNTAFYYYKLAADLNDPVAQFYVGNYYYEGKFILQDITKAIYYFELSANQNNEEAQYRLGTLYLKGEYVKLNIKKALFYFELSAKKNFPPSLYKLGMIYYSNTHIRQNMKKSIHYLKLSAKSHFLPAIYQLAAIYYTDKNNINKAIHYFTLAANQDHTESQFHLGYIYYYEIEPVEINKVLYYFNLAAQKGDCESQYYLGVIYYEGEFVAQDINKALHYFTLSAKQDFVKAEKILGYLYYNEPRITANINKSIYYFSLAANHQNKESLFMLGKIYYEGKYVKIDMKKSIQYFLHAADLKYIRAFSILGEIYYNGIGIKKDVTKGIHYLTLAANQKDINALFSLANLYLFGENVQKDINKSIQYFSIAAYQNDMYSQYSLFLIYFNGIDVKRNVLKGIDFLIQSSKNDFKLAHFSLGFLYFEGKYIPQDIKKSISLYKEASNVDVSYAKNNLGVIYRNGFKSIIQKNISASIDYLEEAINKSKDIVSMFNLAHIYIYEDTIKHDFDKAIRLLIESSKQYFCPSKFLLCFALIKKVGSNMIDIKEELLKYIKNKKNKLFKSICKMIVNNDLLDEEEFLYQDNNIQQIRILYDYEGNDFLLSDLIELTAQKKLHKRKKVQNINSDFYEGFGILL